MPNDTSIRLDLRLVCALLAIALVGCLVYIGLTYSKSKASRTVSVTGKATVSAEPDQHVFMPSYEKKAATSTEAISQVSTVGNAVIAKLKELGAEDKDLKTNVSANKQYIEPNGKESKEITATYQVTATIKNTELAKKIQEYLASTPVLYSVTPQSSFSKEKTKQLVDEATTKGIADARTKAESQSKLLGVRLGRLISASEPTQYAGPITLEGRALTADIKANAPVSPTFEIGTQELTYSISVVYEIK